MRVRGYARRVVGAAIGHRWGVFASLCSLHLLRNRAAIAAHCATRRRRRYRHLNAIGAPCADRSVNRSAAVSRAATQARR
jgi:pimeloyl-ACP methyl ester carboxylesterase